MRSDGAEIYVLTHPPLGWRITANLCKKHERERDSWLYFGAIILILSTKYMQQHISKLRTIVLVTNEDYVNNIGIIAKTHTTPTVCYGE